ncbi:hypothetical protein GYM75_06425 [Gilliamella sp. ESL0441]|uniref:phage tail length tape measure family protein n=1 Tax=Gilliamella sp. ESL0441 TaxID=2704654 RepID=UPI001C6A4BA1|nr:phage tail length tape measure family protein [Gilliamella sp. ESL0441]QYN44504.1 hypothetical protein GYM75_06425 [Gilliamella sp. ESL0441]
MANNDMNIAMKFTADVNRAKKNIHDVGEQLKNVYEKQTDAMNRGQRAIIELLQQEKAEERAQEAAAKAAKEHQKEVEKLRQGLDKLLASIDPATKGLSRLDELESKLRKSRKAGVIDRDAFDDYLGKINNQRAALSTVDSINEGTKKLVVNTKSAHRSFFMMSKQLATGNFNGIGNSLFSIANMTGKLPPLFNVAALSVGVFIVAVYKMCHVVSTIISEHERFNRALISTGNYAGTTAGGLEAMSQRIGKINHNYSETREVIAELAASGKLSSNSIENIASAAAYMSSITQQSAQESIQSFKGIEDSVVKWAMTSSKQYNWLDIATYQRISALEEQGKTEEAIAIATDKYAAVMEVRANEMATQLNWLTKNWQDFKNNVSEGSNIVSYLFKNSLSLTSDEEELEQLKKTKSQLQEKINELKLTNPSSGWLQIYARDIKKLDNDIENLQIKLKPSNYAANLQREQQKIIKDAVIAGDKLNNVWKNNRTESEKQANALEDLRKNYAALWKTVDGRKSLESKDVTSIDGKSFSGGQYDKDVKQITDKGILEYNKGVEKSLKLTTELQRVMYEINNGQYKNASQAEKDRAIALAKQVDAKNVAKNKKTDFSLSNDKTNLSLQQQLNELLLGTKASDDTVEQWYNNLLAQFKKTGNKEGIDLIDQILPLKKAEVNLNEITTKIQQAQSRQSTKEQSIQAQVTSGLITQVEAQSQLVDLHKQTAQELAKYLPILQAMTELPGQAGENAQKALATLQLQIAELNKTTDALTNAFKSGLQSGIQGSLDSLAKGTFELKDALQNLAQSILSSMAQVATKGLADMAMNGLSNLGSSLFCAATDAAVDNASAAASAGLMETAIATSSATGAGLMGESISMSAGIGAETISASMVTAGTTAGEIISAAMISASSASAGANAGSSAIGAAAVAAATGGYITGAGTSTSDSIPAKLSNGEYVVKAESVKKYGVDYLHAINTGRLHRYATGGLASNASSPKAPNIYDENLTSRATNQAQSAPVIQQTLVLDSGEMMKSGISSVDGSRALMTWIHANAPTLKQVLS